MPAQYGKSPAQKHLERGELDEALDAATRVLDAGPDAGARFDRAQALDGLERFDEALDDLDEAVALDRDEATLDAFAVDDLYFACAVAAARRRAADGAALEDSRAALGRYATRFPEGAHVREAGEWDERLRGVRTSLLDKTVEVPDV